MQGGKGFLLQKKMPVNIGSGPAKRREGVIDAFLKRGSRLVTGSLMEKARSFGPGFFHLK